MTNQELVAFIKKNPISVGCGVLCLAVGVAMYLRSDLFPTAETTLAEKSDLGQRYITNIKNSAQLQEQFDRVVAANKEIDSRVLRSNDLGVFSEFFYKLESDTGVKFREFRPNPPSGAAKGKSAFVPVSFSITATGDMGQLLQFLRQLESGAQYARIMSAAFSVNNNTRSEPIMMALNLEVLGKP